MSVPGHQFNKKTLTCQCGWRADIRTFHFEAQWVNHLNDVAHVKPRYDYFLELLDYLIRPIQEGGAGMSDSIDSPLSQLRIRYLASKE